MVYYANSCSIMQSGIVFLGASEAALRDVCGNFKMSVNILNFLIRKDFIV